MLTVAMTDKMAPVGTVVEIRCIDPLFEDSIGVHIVYLIFHSHGQVSAYVDEQLSPIASTHKC